MTTEKPKIISKVTMAEANQAQNQRRITGDFITYVSPTDITSVVRPTMNEKIVEMNPARLQLISYH